MDRDPSIYLVATSQGSLQTYSKNTANSFTNDLKTKINLNPNTSYEVGLTNLHVPAYSCILHKNDHLTSNIQYNIGLFHHVQGRYVLDKNFNKKIFSLAPNRNINGLYRESEHKRFDLYNPLNRFGNALGKDVRRSEKDSREGM